MEREKLKQLGLTDEQVNAVMAEHGSDIAKVQAKLSTAEAEKNALQEQINNRDKDIAELRKAAKGDEDLTKKYKDLQDKYNNDKAELEQKLADSALDHAIDMALAGKVHDAGIVRGLLNRETLKLDDKGILTGLDEQVSSLNESHGFLFIKQEEPVQPKFAGFEPAGLGKGSSDVSVKSRAEQLAEMANEKSQVSSDSLGVWG